MLMDKNTKELAPASTVQKLEGEVLEHAQNMLPDKNKNTVAPLSTQELLHTKKHLHKAILGFRVDKARSLLKNVADSTLFINECNQDADFRATYQTALYSLFQYTIYVCHWRMMLFLVEHADQTLMEDLFTAELFEEYIETVVCHRVVQTLDIMLLRCREDEHRSLMAEAVFKKVALNITLGVAQQSLLRFLKHAKDCDWEDVFSSPTCIGLVQKAVHLQLVRLLNDIFANADDHQIQSVLEHVDLKKATRVQVQTGNPGMLRFLLDFTSGTQKEFVMDNIDLMACIKKAIRLMRPSLLKSLLRVASLEQRRAVFESAEFFKMLQKVVHYASDKMFCCMMEFATNEQGSQIYRMLGLEELVSMAVKKGFDKMLLYIFRAFTIEEVDQLFASIDLVGLVKTALKHQNIFTLARLLYFISGEMQVALDSHIDFAAAVEDAIKNDNLQLLVCLHWYGSDDLLDILDSRVDFATHVKIAMANSQKLQFLVMLMVNDIYPDCE